MRLNELAHQIDIGRVSNLEQHDRQIAGNRVPPEAGLSSAVLVEERRVRSQRGIGINNRAREASIKLRVRFGGVELAKHDLAMSPCEFEDAIGETPILIFVD